ncbi:MAG: hypothetical protein EAZ99_18900 [Alphaproteobacteria bacterium]|nr:MAG: hypothetical protein EAZ99_18900 [Alphaproteobacteria bacterium]
MTNGVVLGLAGAVMAVAVVLLWLARYRVRVAEARYDELALRVGHWVWETDADGRMSHMSNYRHPIAASLLGKRRSDIIDPTFRPEEVRRHLDDLAARRPFHDFVYRRLDSDGGEHFIRISGQPVYKGNQFQGYRGIGTNITREWLLQEAEKRAELRLLEAFEAVSIGMALFSRDGVLLLRNSIFAKLFAEDTSQITPGLGFSELMQRLIDSGTLDIPAQAQGDWLAHRIACHRSGLGSTVITFLDGRMVEASDRRLPDGSVVVTHIDMSDQHRRELVLAEERRRLRATLEAVDDGFVMVDADMRVLVWNTRFVCLFDLPFIDAGWELAALLPPGEDHDRQAVRHLFQDLASDGRTARVVEAQRSAGVLLEARLQPLAGGGAVIIIRDITSQRRFEQALHKAKEQAELANRAKTNFLANMSHELRTPLNAIIGFSEIVKDELLGPIGTARYLDYLRDIHMSGSHLLEVINDILDLSKIESGNLELRERPVDVQRAIASATRLLRERAQAAGLNVVLAVAPALPALLVDERALRQIVLNLLSNAIKFTPAGGHIEVSANTEGEGDFCLTVRDTGIGMDEKDIPKALAPFGQVDSSLTRRYEGTGLGLPLVKSLVEMHQGQVRIVSAVNQGTSVSVILPADRLVSEVQTARLALAQR